MAFLALAPSGALGISLTPVPGRSVSQSQSRSGMLHIAAQLHTVAGTAQQEAVAGGEVLFVMSMRLRRAYQLILITIRNYMQL